MELIAYQDTRNLCDKFNSQGPAFRILRLSSRVLGVRAPGLRVKIPGSLALGSWVSPLIVSGSPVSGPDLRICYFNTMSVLQDLVFTS